MPFFLTILASIVGIAVAVLLVMFVVYPLFKYTFKGIGWLFAHVWAFVTGMITSLLRAVGAVFAMIVFMPLILLNVVIGRWSAASHFGRGLQSELQVFGRSLYRFFLGHPARFLMLTPVLEGIERSVPEAVAQSPGADKPGKRTGQFDGYKIIGSLRGGGSGGRLFIAEPDERKRAIFSRRGVDVGQVVIKSFSLSDGSSLPQIIRESRALESARKMGLILEHELTDKRFFYVMPYVPGDTLSVVTHRLHDRSTAAGLNDSALREGVGYCADLLETLDVYHRGGLWHKDVKPDNIIVSDGEAHLVDLGLVTPLRSAMTLTTHGTEYFRDPEMVRMALKGVKVHEVNGAKFDLYAAGAVLYSVIEHSFPAHGGLSQISKRCPEAMRWIVRRSMTDYDKRYDSAATMLADMRFVMNAPDPFAVRPADLPSMQGGFVMPPAVEEEPFEMPAPPAAHVAAHTPRPRPEPTPAPGAAPAAAQDSGAVRPRIVVTDWLTGRFKVVRGPERDLRRAEGAVRASIVRTPGMRVVGARQAAKFQAEGARRSAADQLAAARARVDAARQRAADRAHRRVRGGTPRRGGSGTRGFVFVAEPNAGVAIAVLLFLGACVALVAGVIFIGLREDSERARVEARGSGRNNTVVVESGNGRVTVDVDGLIRQTKDQIARVKDDVREAIAASDFAKMTKPEATGRWVLVNDTAGSSDPALALEGKILGQLLGTFGADVVGVSDAPEDLDAVASARAALGVATDADDEAAKERLEDWVDSCVVECDGVVWLARDDGPERRRVVVIAKDEKAGRRIAALCEGVLSGEMEWAQYVPLPPTAPEAPRLR